MSLFKKLIPFCFSLLFCCTSVLGQCPQGNVILETQLDVDNFAANYPSCTEIDSLGIGVWWSNSDITDLGNLPPIESISGSLEIWGNDNLTSLNGLDNLTSIGGVLNIGANNNLSDLSGLENLASIGGDSWIGGNDSLSSLSGFENLISIGGYLKIYDNFKLTDLSGLENLVSIGGDLWIYDSYDGGNLIDLHGLENLVSIGGDLKLNDNYNLTGIGGLGNLTIIDGDLKIYNNDNLTDLSGLGNLASIGGYLRINNNDNLTDLSGLGNLASIGGDFRIYNSDNLTDLSGLENLTSIGGYLRIYNNDNLTGIGGLGNLASIGGDLGIYSNSILSICEIPFICAYLYNGGNPSIYNNASGCSSDAEVLDACSLTGVYADVFYDLNQNGTKEANEQHYYDVPILIQPTAIYFYTQNDGIYYVEPGSYIAIFDEVNNPNWELTTDSTSYFINIEEGEIDTITFGIYPTQQISHIQTIINSAPARCNETITLDVTTKNLGTTIASGTTWLTIDDAIPEFSFIHQPDTIVENVDTYYGWHFADLYPGQTITKNVAITVPGPPDFNLGEQLVFESFSEFTDANGDDTSEDFQYNPEVRCSYDPNDKLINPNREGDYVLFEEDLIYTIRFQNTGNDVAYDVVIRDTLNTNLDLSTFRLLGSSHADRLNTILDDDERTLTFEFRDIFLPDSTTNFDASQGYVNYLISPFDGLAEETPITNSAGIYFDFNPPVITNTTQSIMVSELPTVSTEMPDNSFDFNVLPNPNSGTFTMRGIPKGTYQIHNTSGQIIQAGNMLNDLLIDISHEAQGLYFISVTVDDTTSVRRVVKM